jgi:hypothetical protein
MAAAISLLCSLGFYVTAVVSDSPALTFHNRFFFESFHESRTTPSESIEVKSLRIFSYKFEFVSLLNGIVQMS